MAAQLAAHYRADWIIDVGCGRAEKLIGYAEDFFVAGIDTGPNLDYCRDSYPSATPQSIFWTLVDRVRPPTLGAELVGAELVGAELVGAVDLVGVSRDPC